MTSTILKQTASSGLSLPLDTYIYSLAQTTANCTAISSDDSLRYFDSSSLSLVRSVTKAHDGITCLQSNSNFSGYVTAGRDGLVKCWDERAEAAGSVLKDPRGAGLTALACRDNLIAAGTESTKEGLGDVSVLLCWLFIQQKNETLLSGATDGLVSIFDATIEDEDDALVQVLNHAGAIHCAGFLTPEEAYAISSDEQLSIYTLSKPNDADDISLPVTIFGDVRDQLQVSYIVDVLSAAGSPAWIAAGDTSTARMTLIPLKPSWAFDQSGALEFPGAHGEEVVRDVMIDSQNQRILTCGEDGQVRLWAQPNHQVVDPMDVVAAEGKSKKRRKDKRKSDKDRFNPY